MEGLHGVCGGVELPDGGCGMRMTLDLELGLTGMRGRATHVLGWGLALMVLGGGVIMN